MTTQKDTQKFLRYRLSLDTLTNSINQGIVVLDKEFRIDDINKSFEKFFRVKEGSLRGKQDKTLYELILAEIGDYNKDKFIKLIDTIQDKAKLITDSFEIILKDEEIYLNVYTAPMFDIYEGYMGRLWTFEDITDLKNIDKMKTEFISIASHQLRTPLSVIYGNLDMLLSGDFGSISNEVQAPLQDIHKATKNLIELVNDLLSVSRLEMGKITAEISEFDLGELFDEIFMIMDKAFEKKNQKTKKELNFKSTIKTDRKLIAEAIKNYLSNAIKYTPENGTVEITTDYKNNKFYFEVRDTGIGIPENQRSGLFNKFFRADNVLTENFEGTGLGLYYVKKSIETLGGNVGYKPAIPGSIFYFEIPL